jgi:hypothetical protein
MQAPGDPFGKFQGLEMDLKQEKEVLNAVISLRLGWGSTAAPMARVILLGRAERSFMTSRGQDLFTPLHRAFQVQFGIYCML